MLRAGMRAFYEAMDRYALADATSGATGEQVIRMHRGFLSESKDKQAKAGAKTRQQEK
jgi:Rrf2 family transcriptional regulator, nitric oxide-sensitive transcriptional repressor